LRGGSIVRAWIEDHVWVMFFVLGVGALAAAPIQLLGRPPDPPSPERMTGLTLDEIAGRVPGIAGYVASISRQLGNFMLVSGALMAAIAAIPFRKGERWAWYSLWVAPLLLTIQFLNSSFGSGWWADLGLIPVTIAGLLVSYRRSLHEGRDRP
jgi:hypothetical protein